MLRSLVRVMISLPPCKQQDGVRREFKAKRYVLAVTFTNGGGDGFSVQICAKRDAFEPFLAASFASFHCIFSCTSRAFSAAEALSSPFVKWQ